MRIQETKTETSTDAWLVTVTQLNSLNIFLIGISLAVVLIVPSDAFLLSYAILGLLHYLTESFGHVALEFPLNFRSLHGITIELRARMAKA